ncbi:MAG: 2-polyprenylphenol 6-hydroxylase [Pseudomonadota bacterium]
MRRFFALFSLMRAGFVLAREGVISALPEEGMPPPVKFAHTIAGLIARRRTAGSARSEQLSRALNRLGPSWVKLGQFLATRPDVVGAEIAGDLQLLQDQMEPFSQDEARAAVEGSIGIPVDELFSAFSQPVAAASIAQVHKAVRASDGKEVAVKVIRPGVRRRFNNDLETFYSAARLLEKTVPIMDRLKPVSVVDMLAQSARLEMDLRLEAAGLSELKENTEHDERFEAPGVDWERTGRDCLTMDWVEGIKMSNIEGLRAAGIDLDDLGVVLIQSFLNHTLRDGFFHADMHPGNLFVRADGTIVAVDLGIAGRLGKKERRFLAEILYGFITRDYLRVSEVHFEAGYVPRHHDVASFAQAIRAIGEPIHGQSAETVSMAKLLTLLFEVTELFDMQTQPQLLLLQKTMVVVEGVARTLDPKFNMWKASEPVVGRWVACNLGPMGRLDDLKDAGLAIGRLINQAPEFAARTERFSDELDRMSEHGMRLNPETVRQIGKAEARESRFGRWALIVIALIAALAYFDI